MDEFVICPWCGQRNPANALECRQCGGPLPAAKGQDPGSPPPPPPRALPKGYKAKVFWKESPELYIAVGFIIFGALFGCSFTAAGAAAGGLVFAGIGILFGGLFLVIGGAVLYSGIRHGASKIRPYERGASVLGEITEIYRDTSIEVNGRNPWAVQYQFEANGAAIEGKTRTWKYAPKLKGIGDKVYVLYLPEDPEQNVLYPPLG